MNGKQPEDRSRAPEGWQVRKSILDGWFCIDPAGWEKIQAFNTKEEAVAACWDQRDAIQERLRNG